MLLAYPLGIEAIGVARRLAVVREPQVAVAQALGCARHLLDFRDPVAPGGMDMKHSLNVQLLDQLGQLTPLSRFDLAHAFAHLWGDIAEAERRKDLVFLLASHGLVVAPETGGAQGVSA